MSFPTTFAHKPVLPVAEVRAIAALRAACGCELRIDPRIPADDMAKHKADLIAACEPVLLDAMGLQTFSRIACVTFHEENGTIWVGAWKFDGQELQAA